MGYPQVDPELPMAGAGPGKFLSGALTPSTVTPSTHKGWGHKLTRCNMQRASMGPASLAQWCTGIQPLLALGEWGSAEQASERAINQHCSTWLLSWSGQPASEEAAPSSLGNRWLGVPTHAPLSHLLLHWASWAPSRPCAPVLCTSFLPSR